MGVQYSIFIVLVVAFGEEDEIAHYAKRLTYLTLSIVRPVVVPSTL
jgi:hypothetical protein